MIFRIIGRKTITTKQLAITQRYYTVYFCNHYFPDKNKGLYKDSGVKHTLDMWHGAKNLGKKIHAVSYCYVKMDYCICFQKIF